MGGSVRIGIVAVLALFGSVESQSGASAWGERLVGVYKVIDGASYATR